MTDVGTGSAAVADDAMSACDGSAVADALPDADWSFSEDELTELALAADPDAAPDGDAVPLAQYLGQLPLMLPQWYMPPAIIGRGSRWRTALVIALVLAFVMIDAWGLCSTYGSVTLA
jgi:hypothetical protein